MSSKEVIVLSAPHMDGVSPQDAIQPLATRFGQIHAMLGKYQRETARLEDIRRTQEAAFQQLSNEMAALQGHIPAPPHAYARLEPFQREAEQLKALSQQFSSSEFATPESAVQGSFGALERMFVLYQRIIIGLREINAKRNEELSHLTKEVEALRDPFHQLPDHLNAIRRGDLSMLLGTQPVFVTQAAQLLDRLLTNFPQEGEAIYNLALFIANAAPGRLQIGTPLYGNLRGWLLERSYRGEQLVDKRDLLLITLGQRANYVPRDLMEPLKVAADLQQVMASLRLAIESPAQQRTQILVNWARDLAQKPHKTRAEQLMAQMLRNHLSYIANIPLLANPEDPSEVLSLYAQLVIDPQFGVSVTGKNGEEWKQNLRIRERMIADSVATFCNWEALQQQAFQTRGPGDVEIHRPIPPADPRLVERLATRVAQGPLSEEEQLEELDNVEKGIYTICSRLTNLESTNPNLFAQRFCQMYESGHLTPALQNILAQGNGEHALVIAQLVYYHQAISNMKQGFKAFASHHEWDWLTRNGLTPAEAARRMQILIQSFLLDRNFDGSAMIPKQVRWASHLYDLMRTGKVSPIYSDAGSGKTSTAIFTMRFLQNILPEMCQNKDVHLLSPFYTQVDGLRCRQLIDPHGVIFIDVADDAHLQDVVLVDEAHILDPDVKIILRSPTGRTREVEPLPMTATPVIPNDQYGKFRKELHLRLKDKYIRFSQEYRDLQAELNSAKRAVANVEITKIEDRIRAKRALYLQYLANLPGGQRGKFASHLDNIEIEELLVATNWLLRAGLDKARFCQLQEQGVITGRTSIALKDYRGITTHLIGGFKPLQTLGLNESNLPKIDTSAFNTARDLFVELERDLMHLAQLREGDYRSLELPHELQTKERALTAMAEELSDLHGKLEKWDHQDALPHVDNGDEILLTLPAKRVAKFKTIEYTQTELQIFSGAAVAAAFAALPPPQQPVIQLIYPGVRFTAQNFPELIAALNPGIAAKCPGKEIYFVYQDSHSNNGDKGQKFAVRIVDGQIVYKQPMTTFAHEKFDPATQVAVLLYDTTNKQGGDFNSLSREENDLQIGQYIFYNFKQNEAAPDPLAVTSANDLYQALSRRREPNGPSQIKPIVMGTQATRDSLVQSINTRQWSLEKSWAARNAATRVAKKLLKTFAQVQTPHAMPGLRHRHIDALHAHATQLIPELGAVHVVDALRGAIRSMPSDTPVIAKGLKVYTTNGAMKSLIHEAMGLDGQADMDHKDGDFVGAANALALWRLEKMRHEITFLTQAAVRYQPVIVE